MDQILFPEGVPVCADILFKVPAYCLGAPLRKFGVEWHRAFRRAARRDDDAVQIEHLVLNKAGKVLLDSANLKVVVAHILVYLRRALLKVDVAGGIGLYPAAGNLLLVSGRAVHKGRQAADIVSQGLRFGDFIQALVLLKDVSGQHNVHLSKLRTGSDGLHVVVDEITVRSRNHGIQPQALVNDRSFDVLPVHLFSLLPSTGIEALGYRVGIVLDGIPAGYTELGSETTGHFGVQDGIEMLIGHIGGIGFEGI